MRIESKIMNKNFSLEGRQRRAESGGQEFTTILSKNRDTIELSYKSAIPPTEAQKQAQPVESVTIYPTDSVQTKLEKLRMIDENTDYSGMGYVDIYKSAWERYDKAFGGNMFAITSILACGEDWCDINDQFVDEIHQHIYNPNKKEIFSNFYAEKGCVYADRSYAARILDEQCINQTAWLAYEEIRSEALGYSGMSMEERETAIYEKYAGKTLVIDFLNLQGELLKSGVTYDRVGEAGHWYHSFMQSGLQDFFFHDKYISGESPTQADWNRILYTKLDSKGLANTLRENLKRWSFDAGVSLSIEKLVDEQFRQLFSVVDRYHS